MTLYTCFQNDVRISPAIPATCEGGAGWKGGKHVAEMHVGGWEAVRKAIETKSPFPAIDKTKARAYWSAFSDGEVVLSNFFEDRTDAYHAKQLVAALEQTQPRLLVAHYGFPSFVPEPKGSAFWKTVGWCIDIICPAYYAVDEGDPENWSSLDYERMAFQLNEARRYGNGQKQIGFCISPQTHQGNDIRTSKLAKQIAFLKASGVQHLFIWSKYGATVANLAAVKATQSVLEQ